jgi:hypothetical protein
MIVDNYDGMMLMLIILDGVDDNKMMMMRW